METNKIPKNMWLVKSDRTGVKPPQELIVLCVNTRTKWVYHGEDIIYYDTYYVRNGVVAEINFEEDKTSATLVGNCSEINDEWKWTYYYTFTLEDANQYYQKELKRVTEKYLTAKPKVSLPPGRHVNLMRPENYEIMRDEIGTPKCNFVAEWHDKDGNFFSIDSSDIDYVYTIMELLTGNVSIGDLQQ